VPILALPHARWCKRIAGQRVAVAADVYWKVERACRLESQRRYFDTATKGRRSENKRSALSGEFLRGVNDREKKPTPAPTPIPPH